jgi:hypothetical protein
MPKTAEQELYEAYAKYKRNGGKKTKAQYAKHQGYSEGSGSSDAPPDDEDVAIDLTGPAKDPMLHPTLTGKKGVPLPPPAAVPSKHLAGYEFKPLPRKMHYKDIAQWFGVLDTAYNYWIREFEPFGTNQKFQVYLPSVKKMRVLHTGTDVPVPEGRA